MQVISQDWSVLCVNNICEPFEYQMGPCISASQGETRSSNYRFSDSMATQVPPQTEQRRMAFHADIANVAIKKYPYRTATPSFSFRPGESLALESKTRSKEEALKVREGAMQWKVQLKSDFEMTEHELRSNCLRVELQDEERRVVARLCINLFLIATGPFHQDFAVQFQNGTVGRMSFDLRLSQVIELSMKGLAAELELLRDHPGQEFSFSIQTIAPLPEQVTLNGESSHSRHSYTAPVLLEKKILELSQEGEGKEQGDHKVSMKQIQTGKIVLWSSGSGLMPSLTTKVLASQLHNTYFQILIWKQPGPKDKESFSFFADTYASFYKLFASEPQRQREGDRDRESRVISITEKIEHYGKDYGKGRFSFQIDNQPYFKQYQICVHTEQGILKTAPIFAEEDPKQICSELEELQSTSERIQQSVIKLSDCESRPSTAQQLRKIKADIQISLEKIFHLLEKTSHPPRFLYRYGSQEALLRGQKVLVTVGARAAGYLKLEDPVINDVCWLILISLAKRDQFSLSHMGFHQPQKQKLLSGTPSNYLKEKLKLVTAYRSFTSRMLGLALNALTRRGSQYESTFAEVYCACAYFKVPEFRREVLQLLWRPQDPEIEEWRGLQFSLKEDSGGGLKEDNIFVELFDWQEQCFKWVGEEGEVREALGQIGWRDRFRQRGQEFFYFLKYWVTYIQGQLPPNKDIRWRYFPGYNRLLLALFAEMKRLPVLEYPDALLECCTKLLANEKLVNPMVAVVLNRVNAFEITAVLKGVDFLNTVFFTFSGKKKHLPVSFSYRYFFKAIKLILEGESSLTITSLLTLLYMHLPLFHADFRRGISLYLLGSVFWRLFLHWSHTVRYCFYHLITYRLYGQAYHAKKSPFPLHNRTSDIKQGDIIERYKMASKLVGQKAQEGMEESESGVYGTSQSYYKRMRAKISTRMRKRDREQSQLSNVAKEDSSTREVTSAHTSRKNVFSASNLNIQTKFLRQREYHSEYELGKQVTESTRYRDDSSPARLPPNFILFQKAIPEEEMELDEPPVVLRRQLRTYLNSFRTVEKAFVKWLQGESVTCPPLHYQFDIDNREIRPKQMENW